MMARDILAFLAGAGITLAVVTMGPQTDRAAISQAHAQTQQEMLPDHVRYLLLALANAIASVAVDGERTAVALNATSDRLGVLADRLAGLEKRLADLEKKR
jgi:hypothetical protein